jgi:hypothetical protein
MKLLRYQIFPTMLTQEEERICWGCNRGEYASTMHREFQLKYGFNNFFEHILNLFEPTYEALFDVPWWEMWSGGSGYR